GDDFSDRKGSADGVVLFADGAEGAPLVITDPADVSTAQAHGGTRSYSMLAKCTPTATCTNTCSSITLPLMTLPAGQALVLSFWASYNDESGFDGLFARVSTDGGVNWQRLDTINYNGTLGGNCGSAGAGINGPPGNAGLAPWT